MRVSLLENVSSKARGSVAHAFCVAYCVSQGYVVSQPLFDNATYDLIIDDGSLLQKVQSKLTMTSTSPTTSMTASYPRVSLSMRSRRNASPASHYTVRSFDLLWVMTTTSFYLIPATAIFATKPEKLELRLYPKWNKFLVDFPHPGGKEPLSRILAARLTLSEQKRISTLHDSGLTTEAIADALGLTRSCVSVYLSREGHKTVLAPLL